MRIPGPNSELNQVLSLAVEPKVVQLIEKLAGQPLLLEKLLLAENRPLEIQLSGKNLKSINLPRSALESLAPLLQSSARISITIEQGKVVLRLAPQPSPPGQPTEASPVQPTNSKNTALVFAKAQLLATGQLALSRQIFDLPLPSQSAAASAESKSLNSAQLTTTATGSLREQVTQFLNQRQLPTQSTANAFNRLQANLQQLIQLVVAKGNLSTSTSHSQAHNMPPLEAISRILSYSAQLPGASQALKSLSQVMSSYIELARVLDFSREKPQLAVAQRVAQSGNFMESRLSRPTNFNNQATANTQTAATPSPPAKPSGKETRGKQQPESPTMQNLPAQQSMHKERLNQDSKLLLAQLSTQLQALQQSLTANPRQASPIATALRLISEQPGINSLLSAWSGNPNLTPALAGEMAPNASGELRALLESPAMRQLISQALNQANSTTRANIESEQSMLALQRQVLREMISDSGQILNKIESNQLHSLRAESGQLQYLLDLPIYRFGQFESFEVLFKSENAGKKADGKKVWTVTVRFDLEPLGPMFARVSLKDERISTHFFAKSPDTAQLLAEHIDHLQQSFVKSGLQVDEVKGLQGIVPDTLAATDNNSVDLHV